MTKIPTPQDAPFRPPLGLLVVIVFTLAWMESETSTLQSRALAWVASESTSQLVPGRNADPLVRPDGPYDRELGYSKIDTFVDNLENNGFEIVAQATASPMLRRLTEFGITPPYKEKGRTGLQIVDAYQRPFYTVQSPERGFDSFEDIPKILVDSLLFIENRRLLAPAASMNPAVEWPRLARATIEWGSSRLSDGDRAAGGSTLATQLEKLRHSPAGQTSSAREKLRQMASASLRAYVEGADTAASRRTLIADYLNTIKLAAVPGHGEVVGLPMGMVLWYGVDYRDAAKLLNAPAVDEQQLAEKAVAYRQALGLILAANRPYLFLVKDPQALRVRIDRFLVLLADSRVITRRLRDRALVADPTFTPGRLQSISPSSLQRAEARPERVQMLKLLGVDSLYEIDRIDARATTTTYDDVERRVQALLDSVRDADSETTKRLRRIGLLNDEDPGALTVSFSMYERTDNANKLRLYADTERASSAVDESVMLDLGSTSKLRVLTTYLELLSDLYDYENIAVEELDQRDVLGGWAFDRRVAYPNESRREFLGAAMKRRYSASPDERFFTGGGLHRFGNFKDDDDDSRFSVRNATRHSINLVFVRLMHDIVSHRIHGIDTETRGILDQLDHPLRRAYLERAALTEGAQLVRKAYRRNQGLRGDEMRAVAFEERPPTPRRAAIAIRYMETELSVEDFATEMMRFGTGMKPWLLSADTLAEMYRDYDPAQFDRAELAYLSGIDWLELWTMKTMGVEPGIGIGRLMELSATERTQSFAWLYRTRRKSAQDRRIKSELEVDVFTWMHAQWKRQGYPFGRLVPSLATALGASADRPAALAELMGIIQADGMRLPRQRFERIRLGANTPYDTIAIPVPAKSVRVMGVEVARILKVALIDVATYGTARRCGAMVNGPQGRQLAIGGKTGTGDHARKTTDAEGNVISEVAVSRSGMFPFLIGDRYFGAVTVFVKGSESEHYEFTSSLATEIFSLLKTEVEDVINSSEPAVPFVVASVNPS
jgi:membrane peptidoglycan carboxypeptidase